MSLGLPWDVSRTETALWSSAPAAELPAPKLIRWMVVLWAGSTMTMLGTMLAMSHGFSNVLLLATGLYLLAGIVLWRIPTHPPVRDPR